MPKSVADQRDMVFLHEGLLQAISTWPKTISTFLTVTKNIVTIDKHQHLTMHFVVNI